MATARGDGSTFIYASIGERTIVKKADPNHVIWMTRKMPVRLLSRMRVLSAQMSKGKRIPLWKIHQLALVAGVMALEKQQKFVK